MSVTAGTIFQDSHLPLTTWFRAMWHGTSQKNGISALGLQRVLGLGSYKTAWAMLHKLRRAMVRPGRERLQGIVEVDEAYWGDEEAGVKGRRTQERALIIVAAEENGKGIGRIRLRCIPDLARISHQWRRAGIFVVFFWVGGTGSEFEFGGARRAPPNQEFPWSRRGGADGLVGIGPGIGGGGFQMGCGRWRISSAAPSRRGRRWAARDSFRCSAARYGAR
jgi:hypothetical protein